MGRKTVSEYLRDESDFKRDFEGGDEHAGIGLQVKCERHDSW
jgi:hypothetical protein